MTIELIFTKYTPEGCASIVRDGFAARRAGLEKIATHPGARVGGYWATDDGWDSMLILEGGGDQAGSVSANLYGRASGQVERFRRYRLYTADQADGTLDLLAGATWPGVAGPSA